VVSVSDRPAGSLRAPVLPALSAVVLLAGGDIAEVSKPADAEILEQGQ
jgi:hypothetical protein